MDTRKSTFLRNGLGCHTWLTKSHDPRGVPVDVKSLKTFRVASADKFATAKPLTAAPSPTPRMKESTL